MAREVLWNGKAFRLPQAASRIDSSGLNRVTLGGSNVLAILCECVGLIPPKTAKKVTNPAEALGLIHPSSEEARMAAKMAFDPARGVAGASDVYIVPVNPATAAALTIDSKITLTSYLFGLVANQVKAKVETGTTAGTKKVSIAFQENSEVFDNLERKSFSIDYTGAGSAATMTIDQGAGTLTTSVTGAAGDNLNLSFATYDTIQSLVDAINATGKYTAVVLSDRPKTHKTIHLDNVTTQDVATVYTAKSDLQGIIEHINTFSAYVSAVRAGGAAAVPANADWAYLSGGGNGTTLNSDWQSAFDLLKTMDVHLVVPLTSNASIWAMGDTHVQTMSGMDGKMERRQFVGGALKSWVAEASRTTNLNTLLGEAKALNSDRTVHVGLGVKLYDELGAAKLYPGYIAACLYAGIAAGSSPVMPLTRKYLNCLGLEVDLRKGEIDDLIKGGVAVPIPDLVQGAGYVISRQMTTWLQDDDLFRIEFSVGRGADYIAREVRKRHELLIGQPGTAGLDATILNITNSVLDAAKRAEYIRDYDPTKTQLRVEGTERYVDYSAMPILPVNWIFSTYHLEPVSFSIQVQ